MIYRLRIFCLFVVISLPLFGLEYSIRPCCEENGLEVSLKFQGNEEGFTEIHLPSSWAGKEELYLQIHKLRCASSEARVEDTDQPEIKKVIHPAGEVVEVKYQVISREKDEIEWYYRPLVDENYFFFFGYCFFVVPKMDDQTPIPITLEWNFSNDWSISNSFATQKKKQELILPISNFLHAVYLGGDFQILNCGGDEAPIYLAIRGDWSFSKDHLLSLIQNVIESHRNFWNDHDFPYYLITVLPIGDDHYMGGTGLTNAFSLFMGDFPEENEKDWKWLAWLLSHEHFHTWNGIKMMSDNPEGSLYWFTEGFTEYYSVKLNHRAHLIDLNDYVDHINSILHDYYSSPFHDAPNETIQKEFWLNLDVQKLPYVRGFLFALEWDRKIQDLSYGQCSLDDLMFSLLSYTQENHVRLSQDIIEQVASHLLPLEIVQADIKKYIIEGQTIVLRDDFHDIYHIEWKDSIIPQYRLSLLNKLKSMRDKDQELRRTLSDTESVRQIDQKHLSSLKEIIQEYGWPGFQLVGEEGADCAWIIVQHADDDLPFQKFCLALLEEAVLKKDAPKWHLAYLKDRILVNEGNEQIYGTQFQLINEEWILYPVKNPDELNIRREEMGLCPIDEYLSQVKELYEFR